MSQQQNELEHGWALNRLVVIDSVLSGRWAWWLANLMNGVIYGDIPQIDFTCTSEQSPYLANVSEKPEFAKLLETRSSTKKQLLAVMNLNRLEQGDQWIRDVVRWWLWSLGDPDIKEEPKVNPKYRGTLAFAFDSVIPRMMAHPRDWAQMVLNELVYPSGGSGAAWFATPMHLCELMTRMLMAGEERNIMKTVHEPCAGTGSMLLTASNHSVFLSGNDIDPQMVDWCKFQMYLYVPWVVRPMKPSFANRLLDLMKSLECPQPEGGVVLYEEKSKIKLVESVGSARGTGKEQFGLFGA